MSYLELIDIVSESVNFAFIGKKVIYIEKQKFKEDKIFKYDDFYELFDPEKNYYTNNEKRLSQLTIKRDFGHGMKQYFFELKIFKLIENNELVETAVYIVATEYLPQHIIDQYKTYCQCCQCRKNRTILKIIPNTILKKFCKCNQECKCMKKETYDNKLLKLTHAKYLKKNKICC